VIHALAGDLLRRPVRVLVVGCSGTGSSIAGGLPYLHQAMLAAGHPGGLDVTLMDGDVISPTNCVRQPFGRNEIGLSKAVVLATRLNLFWGLHWTAVPNHLTMNSDVTKVDVMIGCVDSRAARQTISRLVEGMRSRVAYWLDLGNAADSGQFVLGQPRNGRNRRSAARLRTAAELLPEVVEPDLADESEPSCSALEALERQEPYVNQVLAYHALGLLARLFRYGRIEHHGAFVHVGHNRVQPLAVDPEVWRRLRRRGRRHVAKSKKSLKGEAGYGVSAAAV
jgi:PRTRC genetic system ThiF family protein